MEPTAQTPYTTTSTIGSAQPKQPKKNRFKNWLISKIHTNTDKPASALIMTELSEYKSLPNKIEILDEKEPDIPTRISLCCEKMSHYLKLCEPLSPTSSGSYGVPAELRKSEIERRIIEHFKKIKAAGEHPFIWFSEKEISNTVLPFIAKCNNNELLMLIKITPFHH